MIAEIDPKESYRIHEDWWGRCRTCIQWTGGRENLNDGQCICKKSKLYLQETSTEGYCPEWDSFDLDTAIKILEENETKSKA